MPDFLWQDLNDPWVLLVVVISAFLWGLTLGLVLSSHR